MIKRKIDVLLLKRNVHLGYQGDVISVKRGFARNFLFRNKIAIVMNESRTKERNALLEEAAVQIDSTKKIANEMSALISGKEFEIKAAVDVKGGLYGSISNMKIVDLVNEVIATENSEFLVSKKDIIMAAPIRTLGRHSVAVRLFKHGSEEVLGQVNILVAPETTKKFREFENASKKEAKENSEENKEGSKNEASEEEKNNSEEV